MLERKEELKNAIMRAADVEYSNIQKANDEFSVIVDSIKDTFGLDKKTIKKFIKFYYEESIEEEKQEMDAFYKMFQELFDEN